MANAQIDARTSSSRVLVVDDEPAIAELLRRLLVKEGYQVDVFNDGQEALNAIPAVRPHIVLLDVNMPGLSGIEICRRLKQDPVHRLTPVVMVTGLTQRDVRLEGFEAGADDFLAKPVDPQELIVRVRSLVRDQALYGRPRFGCVDHRRHGDPHRGTRRQQRRPLPPDGQLRHGARPGAQPWRG